MLSTHRCSGPRGTPPALPCRVGYWGLNSPTSTSAGPKGGQGDATHPQAHTRTGLSPPNPRPEDAAREGAPGQHRFWGTLFQGSQPGTTARMLAADSNVLENPGFIFI